MNSDVSFFDAAINDLTVFQLHSSNDLIFNISTASSSLTLNETSSQSTYDVYEHLTNIIVYKYVCLTIFVVGVVGNLLSVLVFSRASLRRRSCAVYFLALAITDIASLCASFIDTVLPSYNNFTLTIKFRFLCKMNPLMIYFTTDLSNFLLAIASIDRAISIQFPQRSKEFCRAKIAISTIMIMSIVLLLKNGHIFWGFEIVGEQNQRSCAPSKDKVVFHRNPNPMTYNLFYSIFDSLDMLFAVVIPFFVMLICNIIIIVRVITSRRSITTIITTTQSKKHRKRHEKDRQLTVMLLGSAAAFLVFTLPTEINDTVRAFRPSENSVTAGATALITAIFIAMGQFNHAIHFYIYTLTGGVFRNELVKLFTFSNYDLLRKPKDRIGSSPRPTTSTIDTRTFVPRTILVDGH